MLSSYRHGNRNSERARGLLKSVRKNGDAPRPCLSDFKPWAFLIFCSCEAPHLSNPCGWWSNFSTVCHTFNPIPWMVRISIIQVHILVHHLTQDTNSPSHVLLQAQAASGKLGAWTHSRPRVLLTSPSSLSLSWAAYVGKLPNLIKSRWDVTFVDPLLMKAHRMYNTFLIYIQSIWQKVWYFQSLPYSTP